MGADFGKGRLEINKTITMKWECETQEMNVAVMLADED